MTSDFCLLILWTDTENGSGWGDQPPQSADQRQIREADAVVARSAEPTGAAIDQPSDKEDIGGFEFLYGRPRAGRRGPRDRDADVAAQLRPTPPH